MSSVNWTFGGDFDGSTANYFDTSSFFSPSNENQTLFADDSVSGATAEFVIGNNSGGYYHFTDNNGQIITEHNAGYGVDFSDNTASCYLTGGHFADSLSSGSADDTLVGGGGADTINAGGGSDVLVSNGDGDRLRSGSGADTIDINNLIVSNAAYLSALGSGDIVDLTGAAQSWGRSAFWEVSHFEHQDGEIMAVYNAATDRTTFKIDVDGDGKADFKIFIRGGDYSDYSHFGGVAGPGAIAPDAPVTHHEPDTTTPNHDHHLGDIHAFVV